MKIEFRKTGKSKVDSLVAEVNMPMPPRKFEAIRWTEEGCNKEMLVIDVIFVLPEAEGEIYAIVYLDFASSVPATAYQDM